jgi:hypothetical protein
VIDLRRSRARWRETKLSILLTACRLCESRALLEKARRVLALGDLPGNARRVRRAL